jgi:hypothetical protein
MKIRISLAVLLFLGLCSAVSVKDTAESTAPVQLKKCTGCSERREWQSI